MGNEEMNTGNTATANAKLLPLQAVFRLSILRKFIFKYLAPQLSTHPHNQFFSDKSILNVGRLNSVFKPSVFESLVFLLLTAS